MRILIIALFLASFFLSSPVSAAFKSAQDGISEEAAWNPNPMKDDITLPMPCGVSMILRAVDISTPALIVDRNFPMGIVDNADPDRQLYEDKFTGYISAPFTVQTLPKPWREMLASDKKKGGENLTWYFIGKYEVSKLQWDSVMNALNSEGVENPAACPSKTLKGNNLPVSAITWFEAQDFLSRYNAWLIKNHAQELPSFPDTRNLPFLRLPTEEEWEYAARGGGRVMPEWWQSDNFFPTGDKKMADFGIFNSGVTHEGPAPIGSRNPNPLGLYDTAGNLEEMVDGLFRMSIADRRNGLLERRLHGASGGLVTKGGNFRSDSSKVLPGSREEHPLYSVNGAVRARDIGFRLVLGGLNLDDSKRRAELKKEASNPKLIPNADKTVHIDDKSTSLEALATILASTEGDLRQNLLKLRSRMEEEITAQSMQDSRNLEQAYRSLLYQAETLRAYAYRYSTIKNVEKKLAEKIRTEKLVPAVKAQAEAGLKEIRNELADIEQSIIMGANYYKSCLEALAPNAPKELDRLGDMTRREYQQEEKTFNTHMLENIDTLDNFISLMHSGQGGKVTSSQIIKTIIPENHYKLLSIAGKKK